MSVLPIIFGARRFANRHAWSLLLIGGLTVAFVNATQWRRDRACALLFRERHAAPLSDLAATPRVSILVAAWNEADMIGRHLDGVASLRYPDLEHVICAGGVDGTYELAKSHGSERSVVIPQQPGEGKQAALRRCLAHASGEIVFLTDADCVLDDRSFERTIRPLLAGEAEASTGGWRPLPEDLSTNAMAAFRWSSDTYVAAHAAPQTTGIHGRNAAVTRTALDQAGAFSADVPSGTDYHLAKALMAAGARIRRVPESEVSTRDRPNLGAYARQQRRWLRNVVLLGLRFGAHNEAFASLKTSLLGLMMTFVPTLGLLLGPSVLVCWLLAMAHGALSKVRYLAFAQLSSVDLDGAITARIYLQAVPVTLTELMVAVLPLLDYLHPKRRPSW